jgi:hypothetical protein
MKLLYLPYAVITLLSIGVASGQSTPPPVQVDNRPIERPASLFTIKTNNADVLIDSIQNILMQKSFAIENRNDDTYEIVASRKINETSFEKILIWFERDFKNPDLNIRVYFLYGVYQKLFGSGEEFKRIKITSEEERNNVGDIKTSIRNINIKK